MGTIGANYDQPEIGNVGSKEALGSDSISQRSKGRKVFVLSSALRKEGGKKRHSSNVEQSSLVFEKVAKLATFFHRSLPISSSEHSQSNDKGGLAGFFKMLNQVQQDQWGASVTNNRRTMGLC